MASGRVKWFNNAKGYGFILPDDGGADLFAHYTSIEMEGYKTLKAGQAVNFDIIDGDKGSHAVKIVPELDDIQAPAEKDSNDSASNDNSSAPDRLETV
ncbi:MAG: cold shock domain-containing protein [Cellvibrionaceae bacterium]